MTKYREIAEAWVVSKSLARRQLRLIREGPRSTPVLLKRRLGFWSALAAGCVLTMAPYVGMAALLARWDIRQ